MTAVDGVVGIISLAVNQGGYSAYATAGSNPAAGDAGTVRSVHGRPPCPSISFGFGGRLAIAAPGYPGSSAGGGLGSAPPPGQVRLHKLSHLLRDSDPAMAAGSRQSIGGGYLEALGRTSGPMVGRCRLTLG